MNVVHLAASPFFGGPERQMLGLARHLPPAYRSIFLSFAEGGRCAPFLEHVHRHGFEGRALSPGARRLLPSVREVTSCLREYEADVLCCHGYKPDLVGWLAARRAGVPIVSVSRGWTAVSLKVRINEALDRFSLRWMDHVVCVSHGQAARVRRAGVTEKRLSVIHNAIRTDRFDDPDPSCREALQRYFSSPRRLIVGAAGRLSPEKGFAVLVDAAAIVLRQVPDAGFVVFGEGPLADDLTRQIAAHGLEGRFVLAGFRDDVDRFQPHLDLSVLPSYTEGLPNAVLEACAARVPVVATAVGGTPEVLADGDNGYLVPPGDADALAHRIRDLLDSVTLRRQMGKRGRERVETHFTFEAQSQRYQRLFATLSASRGNMRRAA
jgi:glycosyltransferase involved in cell wall biosynthesis